MKRINLKKVNVARADTIRAINRQIVLNYVRELSPISRADIAKETALRRSTISLIVDELKDSGMIEEIDGESTGGRPPVLLRLRAAEPVAIGVGVGTQRTIIATSDLAGRVLELDEFRTDPNPQVTINLINQSILRLLRKNPSIEGIGVSVPGLVDFEAGDALFIPHYKWRNWAIKKEIEAATGLPVTIDNDANAAALAELWFGRPEVKDVRGFIMVLVEEGLGTGIVINEQVYRGQMGTAGEFGHMIIGSDAPTSCASGSSNCWEAFASESAALARYKKYANGSNNFHNMTFEQLIDRAMVGEQSARTALLETAHYLGVGISNLVMGLSPDVVIVSGRIVRAWSLIADEIKTAVVDNGICRGLNCPNIIFSSLGEKPQLMGAISLILASKFSSVLVD